MKSKPRRIRLSSRRLTAAVSRVEPLEGRVLLTTSSLVYPGPTGHLVYVPDPAGDVIPNFSTVGYETGDVPFPNTTGGLQVPVMETVNPGAGDMTTTIQNAINAVETMPLQSDGFRGAVLLTAGNYPISGSLTIDASGVILEGQGNNQTTGTALEATGTSTRMLINVMGSGSMSTVGGTTHNITDSYVPVGATTFHVDSTSGLAVGDTIIVSRPSTQAWIDSIGMQYLTNPWTPGSKNLDSDRVITAISGNQITIDAPLTNSISSQYGGGTIYEYAWPGRISQVGIMNLYTYSDSDGSADANHANGMLNIDMTENAWIDNVTADNYALNVVEIGGGGKWITFDDDTIENTSDTTANIDDAPSGIGNSGQLVLVENTVLTNAFHAISEGGSVPGPNVYYNLTITNPAVDPLVSSHTREETGPHQRYATGGLFDNVTSSDYVNIRNAGNEGSGHGWQGANFVLWNVNANTDISNPPGAQNWVIGGSASVSEGTGYYDDRGTTVTPQSLYMAQMYDRETPTVATAASAVVSGSTVSLATLGADVAGESTLNYTWSTLSAPTDAPAVNFSANGTNAAKNSAATLGVAGTYTFLVTIQFPGGFAATSSVTVVVGQSLTSISVAPNNLAVNEDTPQQYTAIGIDQFGNPLSISPNWSATDGTIRSSGLFTSDANPGSYSITATVGSISGSANVTVTSSAPVIAAAATASPGVVTGTTTTLSALAVGDTGQFTYTWSVTSMPASATAPTFSVNGTNAASSTVATFSSAGSYTFQVSLASGGTTVGTSSLTVLVDQTLTKITASPSGTTLNENSTRSFSVIATDQFGIAESASIAWSTTDGTIGSGGLLTTNSSTGGFIVRATSGSVSGTAGFTVVNAAPTVLSAATALESPVTTNFTELNVLGADDGGESNLTYTWSVTGKPAGATTPTFQINASNAAKSDIVTFFTTGTYTFQAQITDSGGLSTTSSVTVAVADTAATVTVTPATATVGEGNDQQYIATAYDQFGLLMSSQPSFSWTVVSGGAGGTISTSGEYTAPDVTGTDQINVTAGNAGGSAMATVISTSLGIFTANEDIGAPALSGSSGYDSSNGVYSVSGAGTDISGTSDQFQYLYTPITGDAEITAEVLSVTNTNSAAKAGVMFRNTLDAGSADMLLAVTPGNGIKLEGRTTESATASIYDATSDSFTAPYWIRLIRVQNSFAAFMSPNGVSWTLLGAASTTMNSTIYVGLAVSSHNTAELNTSTFSNVTITGATSYWTGGGDGTNWSNSSNWAPAAVPDSADNVSIPSGVASVLVGTGSFALALNSSSPLNLSGGTLMLLANSVLGGALTIQNGGQLDLTNTTFMLDYGSSDPISSIQSYISSGAIFSSSVVAANASGGLYAVGYADGADGIVSGLSSGQIEIKPTLVGDATLSGSVTFGDFQLLAEYFGQDGGWDKGNFRSESTINFGDYQLLAENFGLTESLAAGPVQGALIASSPFATASAPAAGAFPPENADDDILIASAPLI
jgi:hypothetical protein